MNAFRINSADQSTLAQWHNELTQQFEQFKSQDLSLDLTRGKPSSDQLDLSHQLDGILQGNYLAADGTDCRNYGGIDGIHECKTLFAQTLGVTNNDVLIGGNASLTLMYQAASFANLFGFNGADSAWKNAKASFICPVPGYDRHFSVCEELGINMIPVAMDEQGPDMDAVEQLIKADDSIRGMWCVPRFSNPSGVVYSDDVVERIAKLGLIANENFRVFWDNAYAIHFIDAHAAPLASIMTYCKQHGTEDSVLQFGSTSKITFAGSGISYMASSDKNRSFFKKHLGMASIGPDKMNQLRHVAFFQNIEGLTAHMQKHADLLKPRFTAALDSLEENFAGSDVLSWTMPQGGYFISVDSQKGLAKKIIQLANKCGVKLTPAGATFPYGNDPEDSNIRLAPSFPSVADIKTTMDVFACCVKLASVEKALCP